MQAGGLDLKNPRWLPLKTNGIEKKESSIALIKGEHCFHSKNVYDFKFALDVVKKNNVDKNENDDKGNGNIFWIE